MDFSQVAAEYHRLKAQFEAGALTEAEFKAHLDDLMAQDDQGRWWTIGAETGLWYIHDGERWVQAEPPGVVAPTLVAAAPSGAAAAAPPGNARRTPWPWIVAGMGGVIVVALILLRVFNPWPKPPATAVARQTTEAPAVGTPSATSPPTSAPTRTATPTATLQPTLPPTSTSTRTATPTETLQPTLTPTWTPTPAAPRIAFHNKASGNWDLWIMNEDGADQRPLLQSPLDELVFGWSHATRRLLYTQGKRWKPWGGNSEAYAMTLDGKDTGALTSDMSDVAGGGCSPDGRQVAVVSNRRLSDSPQTICGTYHGPNSESPFDVPLYDIFQVNADAKTPLVLAGSAMGGLNICGAASPGWSPDGRYIAFGAMVHENKGNWNIYRMDADGSALCVLAPGGSWQNEDPTWSPDGRWIAFISDQTASGNTGIFIVPSTCDTRAKPITFMAAAGIDYLAPAWSPDGRWIAYSAKYKDGNTDIFKAGVDANGKRNTAPQQLTSGPASESGPIWIY